MSRGDGLSDRPISRFDVLHMIKRRAQAAALPLYLHRCDGLSKSERGRPRLPKVLKTVSSDLVAALGQNAEARTVAGDPRARIAQGWAAALE
jgi:hypothetical protein